MLDLKNLASLAKQNKSSIDTPIYLFPSSKLNKDYPLQHLIIDIGNTRTKLGRFQGKQLLERTIWEDWNLEDLEKYIKKYPSIQRVAVSTVTYIWEEVEDYLQKHFYYLKLTHETPLPLKNDYQTPETLGKDRLASVHGAYDLFPHQDCLVIDTGTCIKYDLLSAAGHYRGGNIAPGIEMRLKAMHQQTARLPKIEQAPIQNIVGKTTETALRNGGQLGALMEMEAFIQHFEAQFGQQNVILTGGDALYFVNNLKKRIFVNSNLVLIGLNKILTYNVENF